MIWKIFFANIYFTDFSEYKKRPVLLISKKENDCLCLPITSQNNWKWFSLKSWNLEYWELTKESFILLKPYLLSTDLFENKEKAKVKDEYLQIIKSELCEFYWC